MGWPSEAADLGWVPRRLEVATPEGPEVWHFAEWRREERANGLLLPRVAHQTLPAGNTCAYELTDAAAATTTTTSTSSVFAPPYLGLPPSSDSSAWPPTAYATSRDAAEAICARGEGGHVLVVPELSAPAGVGGGGAGAGGRGSSGSSCSARPGWFVLDTSCAGYAIEPSVADALAMPSFGELAVVGVSAAALRGSMRRGGALTLGAVTARAPLFMEQALAAALRTPSLGAMAGGDDDNASLVGVLGTDFMQRAVVEIRAKRRVPGSPDPATTKAFFHAPDAYAPSDRVAASWQRVEWIGGVPHLRVKVTVANDRITSLEPPPEGAASDKAEKDEKADAWTGRLFRLSLGAGGAGVVVAAAAAREWRMVERTVGLQPGGVMSGPGEGRARLARVEPEVVTGRFDAIELKGATFRNIRALTHLNGDPPDLALSPHADGVLCADLFRGCVVVLDFSRDRVAVVQDDVAG
jgi:hypothetical protein